MTQPKLPKGFEKSAEGARKLLNCPQPEKLELGQVWRVNPGNGDPCSLCILTMGEQYSFDRKDPDVRVTPLTLEYKKGDLCDDYILKEEDSPLGMPYLVEVWNDRPVLKAQLEQCFGKLSEPGVNKLLACLNQPHPIRTERQKMFRRKRIRKMHVFSAKILLKLMEW